MPYREGMKVHFKPELQARLTQRASQQGRDPDDWKPMTAVGPGVREIRIREEAGMFRVIYVTRFAAAVYVLHCFQKKTQKTGKADLDLATKRYRDLVKEMNP